MPCSPCRTTTADAASRARSCRRGLSVRAAERAARWAGAKTKPRKVPKVDPVLAERVCKAAERLTGFPARIVSGRLEIAFTDETELAELAEALERL